MMILVGLCAAGGVAAICGGCGSARGKLFEGAAKGIVWPEPPEKARIGYVGALSTQADLKREVSGFSAIGNLIFGKEEVGAFVSPRGVWVDEQERLFVADTSGGVVHVMDMRERKYEQISKLDGDRLLMSPVGVVVSGGNVYVSDSVLGEIEVFGVDGKYKYSFGGEELDRPCGMGLGTARGRLYVADTKKHVITIFDPEGKYLGQFGEQGSGRGSFNYPTYVWVDGAGKVYVSDALNYRVQVFEGDGSFVMQIGGHGNRAGYFAHPCGIATDSFGNIYVADKQFENVQIFNSEGQILMSVGQEGHGPGEFWLPAGMFIDKGNRIFVADSYNKRVQVLQLLEAEAP
jgi:sugar lactone lactonase YvrE